MLQSSSPCFLVFDLGLTNCKSVVFSSQGKVIGRASAAYKTYVPQPSIVEQDPDEWWQAVCSCTHRLWEQNPHLAKSIEAISVTGQMHTLVALGRHGRVMPRALVLGDQRSIHAARDITEELGLETIYQITGARMDASMPAAKIRWLRDTSPEAHKETWLFTGCKDYIRYLLTGDRLTDPIDACATSLYNLKQGSWADAMLLAAGVRPDQLPEIASPAQLAGSLQSGPASILCLKAGIPVVVGGGDDIEVLGNGLLDAGKSLEHLGTTGSILTCSEKAVYDPEMALELYPHAEAGLWVIGGSITTAGAALDWACQILGYQNLDAAQDALRGNIDKKSEDSLLFIPHLLGERCPAWHPTARGSWLGMALSHTRADIMRSVFEGTTYALKQILERMEVLIGVQESICVAEFNPSARSWLQMRADIYNRPLSLLRASDPTALGAMILAAVGIGLEPSIREATIKFTGIEQVIHPDPIRKDHYQCAYEKYQKGLAVLEAYWA